MPTYSYRCTKCENVFDAFHSMSCKDAQYCPICGGVGTKLLSASSIIFKGSGFYTTDYRDSGYIEAKKQDAPKAAPKTGKTEASKDASSKKSSSSAASASGAPVVHSKPAGAISARAA